VVAALLFEVMLVFVPVPREPEGPDKGPGFLGVTVEPSPEGVVITELHDKSPAKKAGLNVNDVILKYDGKPISETDRFVKMIIRTRPNTVIPMEIRRGDKTMTIKVKIGLRPDDFPFPLPNLEDEPQNEQLQPEKK
jgi:S1-C subfamily serine protease